MGWPEAGSIFPPGFGKVIQGMSEWKTNLLLSVQALAEFFSVATRKLSPSLTPAEALDQVNLFIRLWPVFDLTPMIVLEAGRGVRDHKLPYYDAQVWATARLNQVPVVFSEDFRDGSILEGMRFVNSFSPEFLLEKWL